MNNYLKSIEKTINIKFNNKSLLLNSFVHKSFNKEVNNEKLEFLGDRVIGLIISKKLITLYPNENEGIIDKKFASLVNKKTCALISDKINLKRFMILGSTYKIKDQKYEKITGDCLEALIGAIFTDGGLKNAEKFILNFWDHYLKLSNNTIIDSKTKLQEYSLKKFKKLPTYVLLKTSGPHHKPLFKVKVKTPDSKKEITGTGHSKKQAQQDAAKKMIIELKL